MNASGIKHEKNSFQNRGDKFKNLIRFGPMNLYL